ncbi:peroxiredoxin [Streptomyces alkaliterrae]|uniref:thioredoxin-dependent peroxiredoxin n=1 Tax=Streptomyces alkaliterrae TaxID=2213162 RepID=A0A5P0YRA9_9ACTN|nr:peroxiredoxin [Streptomyces alkaliterrae]MBB1256413.1 peroxiredoxin [Streptomyces alkaliterrae]MBB1259991.1 peroxiredoxin [Streptomyces alkaliterrae]MQS02853.1 redoxin domain-containing protein [Streptomyces alkaliterrae]
MAHTPRVGEPVRDFTLPGGVLSGAAPDGGDAGPFERREYSTADHRGRPLVLAFYPGDNTPVCTKQLCSYSSGLEAFTELGADVWGISPQSVDSHEEFARRHGLRMPLLADQDRAVARAFGVAAPGIGLRRSVFLIAPDGTLHWKHVALLGATFQSPDKLTEQLAAFSER